MSNDMTIPSPPRPPQAGQSEVRVGSPAARNSTTNAPSEADREASVTLPGRCGTRGSRRRKDRARTALNLPTSRWDHWYRRTGRCPRLRPQNVNSAFVLRTARVTALGEACDSNRHYILDEFAMIGTYAPTRFPIGARVGDLTGRLRARLAAAQRAADAADVPTTPDRRRDPDPGDLQAEDGLIWGIW